ncbi:MAG: GIY-YIG nuclease family protein, partial [Fulvivirga sp.]|nr:GIY-YIG nuclease family protein [Fulvivirga sp.]
MYSVYILYSSKLGKFYIGYSSDVSGRLNYHNSEFNTIWTRHGQPWERYFVIEELGERLAVRMEKHIKRMKSKEYIKNLKEYPEMVEKLRENI